MFDSHLHTSFSTDSRMKIEEVMERCNSLNIGAIITEHMDLKFPRPNEFIFDVKKYFEEYQKYRNDKLLLGFEMGMRLDCIDENKALVEGHNFDYVIGSVHLVNGKDIYGEELYCNRSKDESYEEYLNCVYDCVKEYDFFDCLGHLDYICRYSLYEDRELYYKEYSEKIDTILKLLVEKEKALEINTKRLKDKKAVSNLLEIYKRYNEIGGKLAVLGSDSHIENNIGYCFDIGKAMAEAANLKLVYYKNRKPQYI